MAASISAPLTPFLRPLTLPRPATFAHFHQFSTKTPCLAQTQRQQTPTRKPREDRNLTASRTAPSTYPPRSLKSLPRPKESRASRRTAHPTPTRAYPTRHPSHHPPRVPRLNPLPVPFLPEDESAPNLAYFVKRTASNELPVYQSSKTGPGVLQTRVQKVNGRVEVLRDELRVALGLREDQCVLKPTMKHVVLKGHWKAEVDTFLRERRF